MTSDRQASSQLSSKRRHTLFALVLTAALTAFAACQSQSIRDGVDTRGVIIVNAPATGEVRRVLVREGMLVNEGAPIIEIAVRVETQNTQPAPEAENPQARAGRNIVAAQAEVEAARAEVVRTEVEVQRLTPLAASNEAPQGQLDGARAQSTSGRSSVSGGRRSRCRTRKPALSRPGSRSRETHRPRPPRRRSRSLPRALLPPERSVLSTRRPARV